MAVVGSLTGNIALYVAARQGASTHALRNDAQKIVCEHERVRRVLANLYPELAA